MTDNEPEFNQEAFQQVILDNLQLIAENSKEYFDANICDILLDCL
jgi:hypothetical protein